MVDKFVKTRVTINQAETLSSGQKQIGTKNVMDTETLTAFKIALRNSGSMNTREQIMCKNIVQT